MNIHSKLLLLSCAVAVSGCTPAIREHFSQLKQDIVTYDYGQIPRVFIGDEILKSNQQTEDHWNKQLCLHEDTEHRVVSMNGVTDHVYYKRCTLSAYPDNYKPQRFEGRPGERKDFDNQTLYGG